MTALSHKDQKALSNANLLHRTNTESVTGRNSTTRENGLIVNPGVRRACNFHNGLQIVPAIAVPLGSGPSRASAEFFLYLSFEHPFKRKRD